MENIKIIESKTKMSMMELPVKSTLVRIGDKVILLSPLPDIEKFKAEIEGFGTPTDIVATSGFHHMGVTPTSKMFSNARLWGVPALVQKRRDVEWKNLLPLDWPYEKDLEVIMLDGMPKIDEAVFYHRESKTLIVSDLFFNHVHGSGIGNWLIFKMFGTYKRFAVSRFFSKFISNKDQFKKSVDRILSLDIERIVVPHGVDITHNCRDKIKEALKERSLI